jgi:DNA-binding transcriptional LysR family regulator
MTLDWDDIRYFVAAANGGSTLAASRVLGVSQTTVARRIDHMEQRLALRLFERHSGGYRLTTAGATMLEDADAVAWDVADFLTLFPSCQGPITGLFRIVVEEPLARPLILPAIDAIRRKLPLVQWELVAKGASRDVAAATDIGVHLIEPPRQTGVACRSLPGAIAWAAYVRADQKMAEDKGPERRTPGPSGLPVAADRLELRHTSGLAALIAAARRGHGPAMLPVRLAQSDPELAPCPMTRRFWKRTPLWMTYPRRRTPEIVIDLLAEAVQARLAPPKPAAGRPAVAPTRAAPFPAIASAA